MIRISIITLLLGAMLGVAGCQTATNIKIQSDPDREGRLRELSTYAWIPKASSAMGLERIHQIPDLDKLIRDLVEEKLGSLGYRKVAHSEADIGLAYHAALLDNSSMRVIGDARSNNPQRERSPSGSHELYIEYEKGALLLEVFERQSEIVLWQGVVSAVFDMNSPKTFRRMTVINSIGKMLDELPRKN